MKAHYGKTTALCNTKSPKVLTMHDCLVSCGNCRKALESQRMAIEARALLLEMSARGMSIEQFAAAIGRAVSKVYAWADRWPEFAEAMELAKTLCQAWWEEQGRTGIHLGKDFNAAAWIMNMRNRFRWRASDMTIDVGKTANISGLVVLSPDAPVHPAEIERDKPDDEQEIRH